MAGSDKAELLLVLIICASLTTCYSTEKITDANYKIAQLECKQGDSNE